MGRAVAVRYNEHPPPEPLLLHGLDRVTTAICLQCGATKFGAWTPCPKCHFTPHDEIARAKSLLLSDHFLSRAELKARANAIRHGEAIHFPEQDLAAIIHASPDATSGPGDARFFVNIAVALTIWMLAGVLILLFIRNPLIKGVTAALLFLTVPLTIVLWVDLLEPLRRVCPSCHKRGVTQGAGNLFDSPYAYDQWRCCRHCRHVFLRVKGQWIASADFPFVDD